MFTDEEKVAALKRTILKLSMKGDHDDLAVLEEIISDLGGDTRNTPWRIKDE